MISSSTVSYKDKHLFLFGPPGAGKGSLSELLKSSGNYFHLVMGDILREEIRNSTPLGLRCKVYMDKGELVPSSIGFELFERCFLNAIKNDELVIVDGMIQSDEYVNFFEEFIKKHSLEQRCAMVYLKTKRETAKNRILNRLVCGSCKKVYSIRQSQQTCVVCKDALIVRSDDCNEESTNKRLDRFYKTILNLKSVQQMIERFNSRSLYLEVDAEKDFDELKSSYSKLFGIV